MNIKEFNSSNEVELEMSELDDFGLDLDDIEDIEFDSFSDDAFDKIEDIVDSVEENIDNSEEDEDIDDYEDGVPIDSDELLNEEEDDSDDSPGFISSTGDFVVMDSSDPDTAFELKIIDIENIAITKRIRKNVSADDITRSIKSTGLLNPVVVAPTATEGIYVLIDGWRRLVGCAKNNKRFIPCIVNNRVSTPEIPILESLYNHSRKYNMKELVEYIDYLEKEKGMMNPSMIEYLVQLNSGDCTKLKDLITDNDEDILDKLFSGVWDIDTAFKKLEQRRKKESIEEKENKKAERVYGDEEESGIDQIAGSGDTDAEGSQLSQELLDSIELNVENLDEDLEDQSLDEMVKEGSELEAFKPNKQKVGERERLDPYLRKSVLARDNNTCKCCLEGGEAYVDALDVHHCKPVFEHGDDDINNLITLCVKCHRLVHLYSTGDMYPPKEKSAEEVEAMTDEEKVLYNNEQMKFKRIVKLGTIIRKGIDSKGISREEYKKENPNDGIGRNKPGQIQEKL